MKDVLEFLNDGHNFFGLIVLVIVLFSGIAGVVKAFRKPKDKIGKQKLND